MMEYKKHVNSPPLSPHSTSSPPDYDKKSPKLKYFFILMSLLLCFTFLLLLFFSRSPGAPERPAVATGGPPSDRVIRDACKASRDPQTCASLLSQSNSVPPTGATVSQVIQSAIEISIENLGKGRGMVQDILDASSGNLNRSNAAKICLEILGYSDYRMNLARDAIPAEKIKDARAWASAALSYQYSCWSGLKNVNDTSLVNLTVAFFNSSLMVSTGNALGMMLNYDEFGNKTESWGLPKTERDGFWQKGLASSHSDLVGGVPSGLKADVTVCKGSVGACDYDAVQDAVSAVPDNLGSEKRFVIWIKEGIYEETVRVPLEKKNVVLFGDGMGKTVITGSRNVGQPGMNTYESATVGVLGDGFMATNLTIQSTAGAEAHQAVAFRSDSDLSLLQNCEFIGNQDTLYAQSMRQYYRSCRIQGNVDFIFGNSAAIFQDCTILVSPRLLKDQEAENNVMTAQGRIDAAQSTGFVFRNCVINGTNEYMAMYSRKPDVHKTYLGRPWKEYSRIVYINCTLEALITSDGWMIWVGDFALSTLYFGEFENSGVGSNRAKRVAWGSVVPREHVYSYSAQNFIQGDQWLPTSS